MSLDDFMNLSENEKSKCLWQKGEPVTVRNIGDAKFILYHIDDFYAEAEYKTDFNEIVAIKAFSIDNLPGDYWKNTDISALNI